MGCYVVFGLFIGVYISNSVYVFREVEVVLEGVGWEYVFFYNRWREGGSLVYIIRWISVFGLCCSSFFWVFKVYLMCYGDVFFLEVVI